MLNKIYKLIMAFSMVMGLSFMLSCTEGGGSPTDSGTSSGTTSGTTSSSGTTTSSSGTTPIAPYAFGLTPTNIDQNAANSLYENFMNYYYVESGNMARIKWDEPDATVSEGIGYGILAALYAYGGAGDQVRFDKLLNYYFAFLNDNKVMAWKINGFTGIHTDIGSVGGATDADLDVAIALFEASKKWGTSTYGSNYIDLASQVTINIGDAYVGQQAYNYYIKSGDKWADGSYNASYISPVAMREFAIRGFTANRGYVDWGTVHNNNYAFLQLSQAQNSGLWSDWMGEDGKPAIPANRGDVKSSYHKFYLDAVRTPWRVAWDYIWYGAPESKAMLDRLNAWAYNYHGANPAMIGNEYTWWDFRAGVEKAAVSHRTIANLPIKAFYGVFGAAAMGGNSADPGVQAAYQAWLDACYAHAIVPVTNRSYFEEILQVLYVQFMSGNFKKM